MRNTIAMVVLLATGCGDPNATYSGGNLPTVEQPQVDLLPIETRLQLLETETAWLRAELLKVDKTCKCKGKKCE